VAFGATYRSATGQGELQVALHQLDASGREITSSTRSFGADTSYARARVIATIDPRAATLRYEIYPGAGKTFRVDNLYAIVQSGCRGPDYPAC
jgi:hypothetical protein